MAREVRRQGSWLKPQPVGDWRTYYEEIWKPMPNTTPATAPQDGMTLVQFIAAREALRGALAQFERTAPTCQRCTHYDMGNCKKFGTPIPAEFQQQPEACVEWQFDGIPF